MHILETSLNGNRVLLRKLKVSDFLDVYKNIRSKEVGKWTGPPKKSYFENPVGRFFCRTVEHFLKGLKMIYKALFKPKDEMIFRLAVVFKKTGKVIGIISLIKNDPQDDFADLGFWIGKKYWGKGLMSEVLPFALKFGFEQLGLNRIEAWTFEENVGSRKVMEKCGFKLRETVEAAYVKYGQSRNRLNYTITISEFSN